MKEPLRAYKWPDPSVPNRDHATGDTVFHCVVCGAPVVDSPQGRAGHLERLGHFPGREP